MKLIGKQRHGGQQEYARRCGTHSQASPAKRIKTDHFVAEPVPTVEIEDSGDEIQQGPAGRFRASTPRARSTVSSRSPHSTASKQSGIGSKVGAVPMSEFVTTSSILIPKRTNPRHKNGNTKDKNQKSFNVDVPSLSAGSLSQGQPLEPVSDDVQLLGQSGLGDFEQGVTQRTNGRHQPQYPAGKVTSRHFPPGKMRIDESTAEEHDRTASGKSFESLLKKNLREFRPVESHSSGIRGDLIEESEDELAQPDTSGLQHKHSPFKGTREGKTSPRQKGAAGKRYELSYVRTHKSTPDSLGLVMRPNDSRLSFRISGTDADGKEHTLHNLDLNSVNRALADDTHRMRLTGTMSHGNQYWYDLGFKHTDQFIHFREDVVFPALAKSSCFMKSE